MFWLALCLLHQEAEKGIQKRKTIGPVLEKLYCVDVSVKTITKFSFFYEIRRFEPKRVYERQMNPFQG